MTQATAFVMTHEPDPTRTADSASLSIIALTITRSLGRHGIKVVRLHPNRYDYSLDSKYVDSVEICPNQYESEEQLVEYLNRLTEKYPGPRVLIPASDDCSLFMASHYEALSRDYALLNPTKESMTKIRDKKLQYELAETADVPIPETYFPSSTEEARRLADTLANYPYVIKPLEAQKWRLKEYKAVSKNKKAFTVRSKEELIDHFERIQRLDSNLMIQEVIGGSDTNLLTFIGYCSANGEILGYCIRSKLRQNPIDYGYCTATISCHNETIEEQSKRLLAAADYSGIVGIEFKYDERTQLYKLIEINTRPVNTTGISMGCGVDVPFIAYCDAAGLEPPPFTGWQDHVVWVRLINDFFAAKQLVRLGRLTYWEWIRSLKGKRVHAILAWDDLHPFFLHYKKFCLQQLNRLGGNKVSVSKKANTG